VTDPSHPTGALETAAAPHRRRLRALPVMVAVLALVAVACGNSNDSSGSSPTTTAATSTSTGQAASGNVPGVTADEIRFSLIGTKQNNPLGTCVLDCFKDGVQAYFDYRNSEGGVDGKKLVVTRTYDDAMSNGKEQGLEIISSNDTFATFSAVEVPAWDDLAAARIPLYVWMIHPAEMANHDTIFGNREVVCLSCTRRDVAYVAKAGKAKKIATLGYGVSPDSKGCAESASNTIEKYSKDIGGAKVVYENPGIAFGLPNGIAPEVTAMKNAGVQMVVACFDLNGMKTLKQEMKRQGMNDAYSYQSNSYDQDFVAQAGGVFDGDYIQSTFRPFEATGGGTSLDTFKQWMQKDNKQLTELAADGWINADLAYQGIKAAGPGFDREKVIQATNKMTDYTAGGLIQPIDWSRQHVAPTEEDPKTHGPVDDCAEIVKVVDGKFVVVGDKSKPFICQDGSTRDWAEPTFKSFK
jgi:ABC-type branched-subunit amino acid transport system substrate-binding protein